MKRGKVRNVDTDETSVTLQIIAVTLLVVDIEEDPEKEEYDNKEKGPAGLAQVPGTCFNHWIDEKQSHDLSSV